MFVIQIEYNFRYLQCPLTLNKKLKDGEEIFYEPLTTLNVSSQFYSGIIPCCLTLDKIERLEFFIIIFLLQSP